MIDKANGGKADALNAGINAARKEYFAGIDADSLLERDALLDLTGQFLFSDEEVVAAGGNIMPVNGCTVRRGDLAETRIPRRPLARFQTVEYLRAFMAGTDRLGGDPVAAHHLGRLRRVPPAPGGRRARVPHPQRALPEGHRRRGHGARRAPRPGACARAAPRSRCSTPARANCWTEIPETFRVLNRQRDRWQRGLLDIVTFHFRMMANPAYGRAGSSRSPTSSSSRCSVRGSRPRGTSSSSRRSRWG